MCIAILSTAHPHYRLIVINNRDEFLNRPTSRADWWPSPNTHVLGARDLARPVHGTWLGITKTGRLAILTNFHETSCAQAVGLRSRGAIVNSWLVPDPSPHSDDASSTHAFVNELQNSTDLDQIGGFNLLCGTVEGPLAVLSNRVNTVIDGEADGDIDINTDRDMHTGGGGDTAATTSAEKVHWLENQTIAISNTHLGDSSWKKVPLGEGLLAAAVTHNITREHSDEDALLTSLLDVLSTDTMPRLPGGVGLEAYLNVVQESIFIPVIGGRRGTHPTHTEDGLAAAVDGRVDPKYLEGLYGTQKQTVVLVGYDGRVRYFERTLYDEEGGEVPEDERDRSFEFEVEQPRQQCSKL